MKILDYLKLFCLVTYLIFAVIAPMGLFSSNLLYNQPPMTIIKVFLYLPIAFLILEVTDTNSWTAKLVSRLRAKFPALKRKHKIEQKNIFLPALHARLSVLVLGMGAVLSLVCLTMFSLDLLPQVLMKTGYLEAAERTYKCLKPDSRSALVTYFHRSNADYDKMWVPVDQFRKEIDQSKVDAWFARQDKCTKIIAKVYGANSFEMMEWKKSLGGDADNFKRYPLAAKFYQDSFCIAKALGLKQAELEHFSWMTLYEALEVRRTDDAVFNERVTKHLKEGLIRCEDASEDVSVDFAAMNFAGAAEMIEEYDLQKRFNSMRYDQRQNAVSEWPGMEVIRITEKYKVQ